LRPRSRRTCTDRGDCHTPARTTGNATNVEIKARVRDRALLAQSVESFNGGGPPAVLRQEDTFFRVPAGRLKLRKLAPDRGELIFYRRPDQPGPKSSDYSISDTSEPDNLRDVLAAALDVIAVVRKERWLYLVDQTRIHLDRVERLGDFVELEVVLRPGQSAEEGRAIAADLMRQLGILPRDLIAGAYLDLLSGQEGGG
jgi:predicted adenylyl cyclase CyaB